ncbi:hypothetical protein EY692_00705 [Enterococcus faecalis]|nr:hypothetical protein [Enterococcus faecalis]
MMLHDTYPVLFNFWRPSRYCSSSNHYVLRDSQHLEGLRYAEHLCEKVNFSLLFSRQRLVTVLSL